MLDSARRFLRNDGFPLKAFSNLRKAEHLACGSDYGNKKTAIGHALSFDYAQDARPTAGAERGKFAVLPRVRFGSAPDVLPAISLEIADFPPSGALPTSQSRSGLRPSRASGESRHLQ